MQVNEEKDFLLDLDFEEKEEGTWDIIKEDIPEEREDLSEEDINRFLDGQKESWEVIEEMVLECQNPKTSQTRRNDLIEELLIRFDPFLQMFRDCIFDDKTYLNNKVSREFISLYIPDKTLRYKVLKSTHLPKDDFNEVNRCLSLFRMTYGKRMEHYNDVNYVFSTLVMKYKQTNRSFNAYVTYVFKYEMFRMIQQYLRDRINNNLDRRDQEAIAIKNQIARQLMAYDYDEYIVSDDDGNFTENWYKGLVCSEDFRQLTELERRFLVDYFYHQKYIFEILKEYKLSQEEFNKLREDACSKIEDIIGRKIPLWRYKRNKKPYAINRDRERYVPNLQD